MSKSRSPAIAAPSAFVVVLLYVASPAWAEDAGDPAASVDATDGADETVEAANESEDVADRAAGDADESPAATSQPAEDPPHIVEARERLVRGQTLGEAGDFELALVEFRRAAELLEDHPLHYLVEYNIGRSYEGLFRYDLAIEHYRAYLEEAGPEAEDRAEVEGRIAAFRQLLARVHIEANVDEFEVWLDGRSLGENLHELMVPGGTHTIELRAEGYLPEQQEVQLPSQSERTVTFELRQPGRLDRGYFWATLGAGAATAAVGLVFGLLAYSEHNRLEELSNDDVRRWSITDADNERIENYALTADILFIVGAVCGVTALILAFFTEWRGSPDEMEASRLHLGLSLARERSALLLSGAF